MIHSEISKEAAGGGRDRLRRDRDRDLLTTYSIHVRATQGCLPVMDDPCIRYGFPSQHGTHHADWDASFSDHCEKDGYQFKGKGGFNSYMHFHYEGTATIGEPGMRIRLNITGIIADVRTRESWVKTLTCIKLGLKALSISWMMALNGLLNICKAFMDGFERKTISWDVVIENETHYF